MSRLRAAIVGTGLIARKKHLPAFARLSGEVDLVAVCDVNLDAAREVAADHGSATPYADFGEMLEAAKPDIVDICTPPATHVGIATAAMAAGSHVLIEKPMAMSVEECDRIVEAERSSGVKVCVAHSDLFYRPFMRARALVEGGAIGDFRGMRIFLSTPTDYITSKPDHWAHRLPGGVIGETGPHVVYLTQAFIRPVEEVSVSAAKLLDYPWSRFEDYRVELSGPQGVSSIALTYASDQWAARVDIIGSRGLLEVDLESRVLVRHDRRSLAPSRVARSAISHGAQLVTGTAATAMRYLTGGMASTHEVILREFVHSIRTGGRAPVTGEEGRAAIATLDTIVEQLDQKYGAPSSV